MVTELIGYLEALPTAVIMVIILAAVFLVFRLGWSGLRKLVIFLMSMVIMTAIVIGLTIGRFPKHHDTAW